MNDQVQRTTGLLIDAYFSATKLALAARECPGARDARRAGELAFGTVDTWLLWRLTGGGRHVTDVSNASRTMLFDIHTRSGTTNSCRLFVSPQPAAGGARSSAIYGDDRPGIWRRSRRRRRGRSAGGPLRPGMLAPGLAKNTYGTGCFLLLNTGAQAAASTHNCSPPWPGSATAFDLCPGRERVHRRFGGEMAARWAGPRSGSAAEVEAMASGSRIAAASLRARVRRPRRALLGSPCAWPDRRPDAGQHRRAHRPRGAGGDLLPGREMWCAAWRPTAAAPAVLRVDGGASSTICSCSCRPTCWVYRWSAHTSTKPPPSALRTWRDWLPGSGPDGCASRPASHRPGVRAAVS